MLRVGVLGCSSIALRRTVPALAADAGVRVTAIASRDPAKAEAAAQRFGATPVHGYERLLERPDIDAVYVPLPPALHAVWVERALHAGKHVLAEKPLTTTAKDAHRLVELARSAGLVLLECFAFVHHSQHAEVQRRLQAGEIGTLRALDADFAFPPLPSSDIRYRPELGGGALLDAGVYPLRVAQLFLGPDLTVAGATLEHDPVSGVDVAGAAVLTTPQGRSAQIRFGFTHSYRSAYVLWGSAGRMTVRRAFTPPAGFAPVLGIEHQNRIQELTLPADDQLGRLVGRFAAAVRGEQDPADLVRASLRQAELVEAVRDRAVVTTSGAA
ncbi:Gfo/Idh/MocA family oxidoreductase [Couchioplanes caeruleus]|uniref:Gfo/Idh/MocA family protein n=1 Tax=Couchioplanes caeruleus TaxID=56438 RepID=UPI0020BEA5A3|nr:Gfo/Idh/MocA family oxidoreductase [Couchioplanes caeruleus]UQU67689.1 Gfo/Idh/MocA family oxidoreductase [Couchioplanes caeruleus]